MNFSFSDFADDPAMQILPDTLANVPIGTLPPGATLRLAPQFVAGSPTIPSVATPTSAATGGSVVPPSSIWGNIANAAAQGVSAYAGAASPRSSAAQPKTTTPSVSGIVGGVTQFANNHEQLVKTTAIVAAALVVISFIRR